MRPTDIERFMDLALAEAKNAELLNEVPIGAIVVNNEKTIIGRGFNQTDGIAIPLLCCLGQMIYGFKKGD